MISKRKIAGLFMGAAILATSPAIGQQVQTPQQLITNTYLALQQVPHDPGFHILQNQLTRLQRQSVENRNMKAWLRLLQSGRYNNNGTARQDISICTAFAMTHFANGVRLQKNHVFRLVAKQARVNLFAATHGQSPYTNCKNVYKYYALGYR